MSNYKVVLVVPQAELPTVMKIVAGKIKLVSATEEANGQATATRYANGKRNKGISGEQLLLDALPATPANIAKIFAKRGFAETSVSPIISKALTAKKIKLSGTKYIKA